MSLLCICGCGRRAVHLHHVVYQQHLHREVRYDPRNLVPVAFDRHGAHHGCSRPLWLDMLPDDAFFFAGETLGRERAYEYLGRRYAGADVRHDRLLEDVAA